MKTLFGYITRIAVIFLLASSAFAQSRHSSLRLNSLNTYTINQGARKLFTLKLSGDVGYIIHAEQKGIDISLTLSDSSGTILQYQDAPNGRYGPEVIQIRPDRAAIYILSVAPLSDTSNSKGGKFTLIAGRAPRLPARATLNAVLTPRQMREDLTVFRAIRTRINSGLYRYRTRKQIDSIYRWAGIRTAAPLSTTAFYKIILTLTDFEGSCHNSTTLPYDVTDYLPEDKGYFPFYLRQGKHVWDRLTTASTNILLSLFPPSLEIKGSTITQRLSLITVSLHTAMPRII